MYLPRIGIRGFAQVAAVAAIASASVTAGVTSSAATTGEVRGIARVGARPHAGGVIWLDVPEAPPPLPSHTAVLDQRNLTFEPRVLAVRVGTTVAFPNNDRVFHNVFSFNEGKRFDLGLYPVGTVKRVVFDRPGVSRVFCNIHPAMAAYVVAVDSPYFAVSDEHGQFVIPSVPPDTYAYHMWRAGGPMMTGSITVGSGTQLEVRWP